MFKRDYFCCCIPTLHGKRLTRKTNRATWQTASRREEKNIAESSGSSQ